MEEKVLDVLEEICGTSAIRDDMNVNLFETGFLDSLGIVELLIAIEEKLNIVIQPTEVKRDEISSPNKIVEFLNKKGK